MWSYDTDRMANSVDPDQTAPFLSQYLEFLWYTDARRCQSLYAIGNQHMLEFLLCLIGQC